jgi:hypothetical protein
MKKLQCSSFVSCNECNSHESCQWCALVETQACYDVCPASFIRNFSCSVAIEVSTQPTILESKYVPTTTMMRNQQEEQHSSTISTVCVSLDGSIIDCVGALGCSEDRRGRCLWRPAAVLRCWPPHRCASMASSSARRRCRQ